MPVMTSQNLKFVDSLKTLQSKFLENKTFFSNYKIYLLYIQGYNMAKNNFLAELTYLLKQAQVNMLVKIPEHVCNFDLLSLFFCMILQL